MNFFRQYFKLDGKEPSLQGEYAVLCPFDHMDKDGNLYKETNPSAHINEERSLFHCKSCGEGISEAAFVSKVEGISYREALVFLETLDNKQLGNWVTFQENLHKNSGLIKEIEDMGFARQIDELQLGYSGSGIDFPVFVYGELLDVRTYQKNQKPKVRGRAGSTNLILPFDLWREDDRPTILAAGEKDMAVAREKGFNAITFTGGEMSFPKLFKHSFKGRTVYIVYDNDQTGMEGARKAAYLLKQAGAIPYIVTGHHEVCIEQGGDLWDYFMKYGKTAEDFQKVLDESEEADDVLIEKVKNELTPKIYLSEAAEGRYVDKREVRSHVNVISIFEDAYSVPEYVRIVKTIDDPESELEEGEYREWTLDFNTLGDILYLMDGRLTKGKRDAILYGFVGLDPRERGLQLQIMSSVDVWKAVVLDVLKASSDDNIPTELLVYSIGKRLMAGKKYEMTYKPVAHPTEGMKVVGVSQKVEDVDTDVHNFKVDMATRERLKVFQVAEGETVEEKLDELVERAKGFIGVEARKSVTLATDMFYHTPLEFKIGRRIERAYLDVMIIGDPRTMKSATAKAMQSMYDLGTVTSLKTATGPGLIGGSDKTNGGYKTKIGLLPQSHKGAVIMEEFSGGGKEIISKLTEIRSSNRVRLTRVNGTTDVPAMVRMLSISNPATSGGFNTNLRNYPSGIDVIKELVGASEDIARYDFFLLVDEPDGYTSPLDMFDLEPYSQEAYRDRVRWVWSRNVNQVEIHRPIAEHIVKCAERLNELYDTSIKLFGAEAWKKLARVAIAVAGMLVSTDENFENIIVKKEHVDYAAKFLKSIYVNDVFRLEEFVREERSYSVCRTEDIKELQEMYNSHSAMLDQMALSIDLTQRQLQVISGLEQKDFAAIINRLGASKFIRWQGEKIVPTPKFRKSIRQVGSPYMERASER